MNHKSREEYWIGKGINYSQLWEDYNHHDGEEYIKKFNTLILSLLKVEFDLPNINEPLFSHEAIYKSFKGLYHDFKEFCLTKDEYNNSKPLFLYSIERGSADWSFLLDPNMIFNFINLLVSGFFYYGNKKDNKKILDSLKHDKSAKTIPEEKINAFITQPNSKIIFENLDKFHPKKIIIKTKYFSKHATLSREEEITIYFDNENNKPTML